MLERYIPENMDTKPSQYTGQEQVHETKKVMETNKGQKIMIMGWDKENGLYLVSNIDKPGEASPVYKIHPDKLREIEEKKG